MSINDKLNQILDIKNEIKEELKNKDSDITDDTLFSGYPQKIIDLPYSEDINIDFSYINFLKMRTSNYTNWEYLFKDYKGDSIDFYNLIEFSEINDSMTGMFHDCINLKILDLTNLKYILNNSIVENMFNNNLPAMTRVIMNTSTYDAIQKILDALPNHTGAAEGDYKFEISSPSELFYEVKNICGTMYRGWTITKKTQEQEKIEEDMANDERPILSFLRASTENDETEGHYTHTTQQGALVDVTIIESDDEGCSIESSFLKEDFANNELSLYMFDVKKILKSEALNSIGSVNLDATYSYGDFVLSDFMGDYDTNNLYRFGLNDYSPKEESEPNTFIFSGDNYLNNLGSLSIYSYGEEAVNNLIIENMNLDNLRSSDISGFKEVVFSNVSLGKLSGFNSAFSGKDTGMGKIGGTKKITFNNVQAPNLRSLEYMLPGQDELEEIDFSGLQMVNSGDISFHDTFGDCSSLKEVDMSNLYLTNVRSIDIRTMFYGCSSLTKINLSNMRPAYVSEDTTNGLVLDGCTNLKTIIMANCPWQFIEQVVAKAKNKLSPGGTLYCDMDMSSILPSGWVWRHSSEYTG